MDIWMLMIGYAHNKLSWLSARAVDSNLRCTWMCVEVKDMGQKNHIEWGKFRESYRRQELKLSAVVECLAEDCPN